MGQGVIGSPAFVTCTKMNPQFRSVYGHTHTPKDLPFSVGSMFVKKETVKNTRKTYVFQLPASGKPKFPKENQRFPASGPRKISIS